MPDQQTRELQQLAVKEPLEPWQADDESDEGEDSDEEDTGYPESPFRRMWLLLGGAVLIALSVVFLALRIWRATRPITFLPPGHCAASNGANLLDSSPSQIAAEMTRLEKAHLLAGVGWTSYRAPEPGYYIGNILAIPRLGLPSIKMQDAAQGWRTVDERQVGQVTAWPCSLAVAASWSTANMMQWAASMGMEFKIKGANVILGPAVNVHRSPFNGRNAEYLSGEDPRLGAALSAAYVRGVQESAVVAAVVKHFEGNQQETLRLKVDSVIDERTLWELYYPPFQAAVDAGVAAVMCGYNYLNGLPACENPQLLNVDLKERMGFRGWVMSDWWAFKSANSTTSGADMEMPGYLGFWTQSAVEGLSESQLDDMAGRVLQGMAPYWRRDECRVGCDCDERLYVDKASSQDHVALARRLATESAVLLKNDALSAGKFKGSRILPLQRIKALAVVGESCDARPVIDEYLENWTKSDYYTVGGSGRVLSSQVVTVLQALQARQPRSDYASDSLSPDFDIIASTSDDLADATEAMKQADVVLVCGGATSSESFDRDTLRLDQEDFVVKAVEAANASGIPSVVLVLVPGAVVAPWSHQATASLAMFLSGQETGNAAADVLLGNSAPSGKLPVTFPSREEDAILPCADTKCNYSEGLRGGWHAYDGKGVDFPFGHGLSYTEFEYSVGDVSTGQNCTNRAVQECSDPRVIITAQVVNKGNSSGAEVAQLYLSFPPHQKEEPEMLLRGFERTPVLAPGQSHGLAFELAPRDISIWDPRVHAWVPEVGEFVVKIGASSRDPRLCGKFQHAGELRFSSMSLKLC